MTTASRVTSSASLACCSTRITASESSAISFLSDISSASMMIGARPSSGSSISNSAGLPISARPMASICCSPPEIWLPRW
jgi:hypothetical protein